MFDDNKLSSRFKKTENNTETNNEPLKFTFAKSTDTPAVQTEQPKKTEEPSFDVLESDLKKALLDKIDSIPVWFQYTPDKQKELIKSFVDNKLSSDGVEMSWTGSEELTDKLFNSLMGFGPLDYLIVQDKVSCVFVNGTQGVHIEIAGKILNTEMKLIDRQLSTILNNISIMSGEKIDDSKNIWNCRVKNLFITVIMPSISTGGVNITIRKYVPCDMRYIIDNNMMTKEIFDFLAAMATAKKNIVIAGDINSGKSTLLNILMNTVLPGKRSVLLEEMPQLSLNDNNTMRFSINKKSGDYIALLTDVLKMMPEYIISDLNSSIPEISDMQGVMTTLRASSVDAAISKLVTEFISDMNLPEKYAKHRVLNNFDYLVQINQMKDGTKKVTAVVELTPARTAAMSVKFIAKLVGTQYVTDIPQPLISIRAGSLISQPGSMSGRFQN